MVTTALGALVTSGRLVIGAFRPGGEGQEWVDAEVLRRLKRRSLAALRKEIEAVEEGAFGRFLPAWQGVGRTTHHDIGALVEVIRTLQGSAVPASIMERDVLPARLEYRPEMLDQLMVAGEIVWIGRGPLGPRDGRIALYLRDQLPTLYRHRGEDPPEGPLHEAIRSDLTQRGASFFRDIYAAVGGGPVDTALDALWDLVWAGEVTNDTLAPLRAVQLRRATRSKRARATQSSSMPPSSSGRWSLVHDLIPEQAGDASWATAWTDLVLERYGVLTRAAALAEDLPGGLTTLYPVLNHMEEIGRIRRGYFVEGMGGMQFALPGAVDRLRAAERVEGTVILAAADPANPYGTIVPWPPMAEGRASRSAGAYVILHDGVPLVFLERGGKKAALLTDDPDLHGAAAAALADIGRRQRRMTLETIDGQPVASHQLNTLLRESGFAPSNRGLAFRGR